MASSDGARLVAALPPCVVPAEHDQARRVDCDERRVVRPRVRRGAGDEAGSPVESTVGCRSPSTVTESSDQFGERLGRLDLGKVTDAGDHDERARRGVRRRARRPRGARPGDRSPTVISTGNVAVVGHPRRFEAGEDRHLGADQPCALGDRRSADDSERFPLAGPTSPATNSAALDSTRRRVELTGCESSGCRLYPVVQGGSPRSDERFVQHGTGDHGRPSARGDHTRASHLR